MIEPTVFCHCAPYFQRRLQLVSLSSIEQYLLSVQYNSILRLLMDLTGCDSRQSIHISGKPNQKPGICSRFPASEARFTVEAEVDWSLLTPALLLGALY